MLENGEPGCWLYHTGCWDDCEYCVHCGEWPEEWREAVEAYYEKENLDSI